MAVALSLLDMATYRAQRALDQVVVAQVTWLLETPPDVERVRTMVRRLAESSLLGRVVVPAPVFGAREHWAVLSAVPEVVVEPEPIDRAAVLTWVGERAQAPVDPTREPWHVAVRPLTDGGHAVTLVVCHTLTDGSGLLLTLGTERAPLTPTARRYDGPKAGRLVGMREALAGVPAAVRAARRTPRQRSAPGAAHAQPVTATNRQPFDVLACIDSSVWHPAATALGGSANALYLSVVAQVAAALSRVTPDGTVLLSIPVGERADGDDLSGNALSSVTLEIPAGSSRDVAFLRAELKRVLTEHGAAPDPLTVTLPAVPYLPARVVRRVAQAALGSGSPVVAASNVGVLPGLFVDAPGPATVVFLNVGVQHPDVPQVPERFSALYTETSFAQAPGGTIALHVSVTSDRVSGAGEVRDAVADALAAVGVWAREIL